VCAQEEQREMLIDTPHSSNYKHALTSATCTLTYTPGQVTCVTGKSLGLLPPGESKKKCFRVVVGADNGILTCFRIKKGEVTEYTLASK